MKVKSARVKAVGYRLAVHVLKTVNPGDVTIRHQWTGRRFNLHSFRHKGYWYHGSSRERDTMIVFAQLLKPGETAVEVGGHIGYIATWIATLVGESGHVIVCEPGSNNLPYLRRNVASFSNIEIREVAVADHVGEMSFFEEELSGQNNSLLITEGPFETNRRHAGITVKTSLRTVHAVTLDDIFESAERVPTLVKVDVEGAELGVVNGADRTLAEHRPAWIIEVTQHRTELEAIFTKANYVILYPSLGLANGFDDSSQNFVCLHRDAHRSLLAAIGVDVSEPSSSSVAKRT